MQEWCLEYKNVEYYLIFLKVLSGKKKKKVREGERKLKIKSYIEKNNLFL